MKQIKQNKIITLFIFTGLLSNFSLQSTSSATVEKITIDQSTNTSLSNIEIQQKIDTLAQGIKITKKAHTFMLLEIGTFAAGGFITAAILIATAIALGALTIYITAPVTIAAGASATAAATAIGGGVVWGGDAVAKLVGAIGLGIGTAAGTVGALASGVGSAAVIIGGIGHIIATATLSGGIERIRIFPGARAAILKLSNIIDMLDIARELEIAKDKNPQILNPQQEKILSNFRQITNNPIINGALLAFQEKAALNKATAYIMENSKPFVAKLGEKKANKFIREVIWWHWQVKNIGRTFDEMSINKKSKPNLFLKIKSSQLSKKLNNKKAQLEKYRKKYGITLEKVGQAEHMYKKDIETIRIKNNIQLLHATLIKEKNEEKKEKTKILIQELEEKEKNLNK